MKKKMALVLALCLIISLFAACGSSSAASSAQTDSAAASEASVAEEAETQETDAAAAPETDAVTPEASAEEAASVEEEPAEEEEIQYFPVDDSAPNISVGIKWMDALYPQILGDDYTNIGWYTWLSEQTGMEMDYTVYNTNNMDTTVPLDIAAGNLPDIITFGISEYYPQGYSVAIEDDIILDLAPYYEEYMPDYYELLNSDIDYLVDAFTVEGYLPYAVEVIGEGAGADHGWIIRQDWLDEAGLDIPETYDDWYEVLTAFKENGHPNALWIPFHGSSPNEGLSAGYGVSSNLTHNEVPIYFDAADNMTAKFGPLEDGYYDFLVMLNKWYEEDLIYADFFSATEEDFPDSSLHSSEKIGIFTGTVGELVSTVNYYDEGSTYDPVGISAPTKEAGDTLYLGPSSMSGVTTNDVWSLNASLDEDEIELACRMVNLFYTEEGTTFANYGLEGITYTKDEDGNIAYTEFVTNNELGLPFDPIIAMYGFTDGPYYRTPTRTLICYNEIQQEAMTTWGDNEAVSVSLSMDADTTSRVGTLKADLATCMMENQVKFIIGDIELTEENFKAFQDDLISMGAEELIDIYNEAYAENEESLDAVRAMFE